MVWTPKGTMWLGIDRQVYLLPFGTSTPVPVGGKIHSGQPSIKGLESIPGTQMEFACATYHDGYYKLAVAGQGETENNVQWWLEVDRLHIDEDNEYGPWFGPMLGQTISCFANQNGPGDTGELIAGEGTAKGYIYEVCKADDYADVDPSDKSAKAIEIKYKTYYNPLGNEEFTKVIHDVEAELLEIAGDVLLDFHDITGAAKTTHAFSATSSGVKWGAQNWGTFNWAASNRPIRIVININPAMKVRRLEIIITYSSSIEPFELYAIRAAALEDSDGICMSLTKRRVRITS